MLKEFVCTDSGATNEKGDGPQSKSASTTTNSSAPTLDPLANDQPANFKVEAGNARIKVTWDKPLDPGINADGTVATTIDYKISYKKSSEEDSTITMPEIVTDVTAHTIDSLENEVEYTVYLWAENDSGLFDDAAITSARQTLTATPSAPVAADAAVVTGTVGNGKVSLSWPKPYDGRATITKYTVYWGDSTPVDTTNFNNNKQEITVSVNTPEPVETEITPLINGTTYYFVVLTYNGYNEEGVADTGGTVYGKPSNTVEVTPAAVAPEAAPTRVTAIPTGTSGEIKVSWTAVAPANNGGEAITGYKIYYASTAEGVTKTAQSVDVPETQNLSKTIDGLEEGKDYYFKVSAYNSKGESELSSSEVSAQAVVGTAPVAAPTGGVAIPTGTSGEIKVSWDAVPVVSNGGVEITGYKIYYAASPGVTKATTDVEEVQEIGTLSKVIVVGDNSTRYFRVSAVNIVGEGELSAEFQGKAQEGFTVTYNANDVSATGSITSAVVQLNGVIDTAPTGFTKTGEYISSWNTQANGSGTTFIFGTAGTGTQVNDHLTLYAQWSTDQSSAPGQPTGVTATNKDPRGNGIVNVSWTAPTAGNYGTKEDGTPYGSGDISYDVYYRKDSAEFSNLEHSDITHHTQNGAVSSTNVDINGLTIGNSYYFAVRARNTTDTGPVVVSSALVVDADLSVDPDPLGSITVQRKDVTAGGEATVGWTAPNTLGKKSDGTDYIDSDLSVEIHYKAADSDFSSSTPAKTVDYNTTSLNASLDNIPVDAANNSDPTSYYFGVRLLVKNSSPAIYSDFVVTAAAVYVGADQSTAPVAPSAPTFDSKTQNTITITWTEPTDTGFDVNGSTKATITGYKLYWSGTSFTNATKGTATSINLGNPNTKTYTLDPTPQLTPGTQNTTLRIAAENS